MSDISKSWHEKSKFYRIQFVSIFLFLIDKATEYFLPALPGGVKHFLLFILFAFNWIFSGSHIFKTNNNYFKLFILNMMYMAILFLNTDADSINFFLGFIFTFLFSIIFYLGINTKTEINSIFNFFKVSIYLFIFLGLFTIIPSLFLNISINKLYFGFFRELGAFGAVMNISCILSLSLFIKAKNKYFLYLAVLCTFFIFLTIMKKSIASNMIIWFFFLSIGGSLKKKVLNFVILGILLIFFTYNIKNELTENISANVEYYENAGESHVRLVMYSTAYTIASENFPFGSGTGTFGSLPSLYKGYSNTYYKYGIDYIEPLSPQRVESGEGHTLFDTYWPHIIGELGVLGTILFLLLWFYPMKVAIRVMNRTSISDIRALCFYVISIGIVITLDGIVLYTPEISSFILFHSGLTGLCLYHLNKCEQIKCVINNKFI
jgi:O-antigen ligase